MSDEDVEAAVQRELSAEPDRRTAEELAVRMFGWGPLKPSPGSIGHSP